VHSESEVLRVFVLTLVTSWVVSQREIIGVAKCRDEVMGPWRRAAGSVYPPNAVGISALLRGRAMSASTLKDICSLCGGCELAPKVEE
jgi:hypothetical protein